MLLGIVVVNVSCVKAFDENHYPFFHRNGDDVIRQCFFDVYEKRVDRLDDGFYAFATNTGIKWPRNALNDNKFEDYSEITSYQTNQPFTNNINISQNNSYLSEQFNIEAISINNHNRPFRHEEESKIAVIKSA